MTADKLGGGMDNNVGAKVNRPTKIGRCKGIVNDQRDTFAVRQISERAKVENATLGIADGFAVERPCFGGDGGRPVVQVGRIDKVHLHRELLKGVGELRHRAAVEMGRGDHFITWFQQGHHGDELRRHAAGGGNCASPPF